MIVLKNGLYVTEEHTSIYKSELELVCL